MDTLTKQGLKISSFFIITEVIFIFKIETPEKNNLRPLIVQ